jgi:hypothetical protein
MPDLDEYAGIDFFMTIIISTARMWIEIWMLEGELEGRRQKHIAAKMLFFFFGFS